MPGAIVLPYRKLFDFHGRETRTNAFWGLFVVASLAGPVVAMLPSPDLRDPLGAGWNITAARFVMQLLACAPIAAILVRRLHDAGVPGLPALPLVPIALFFSYWHHLTFPSPAVPDLPLWASLLKIASVLVIYAIVFLPPSERALRYGPDPRLSLRPVASAPA